MRIVAIVEASNERRLLARCLEYLPGFPHGRTPVLDDLLAIGPRPEAHAA
jgi:hypothetical protein